MNGINIKNFLESSRDIGYSLNNSIGDLIDNSLDAHATKIYIDFTLTEENIINFSIRDNGYGMNADELINAMELSCRNPNENSDKNELGKYGLGLKLSSFAFARKFTVVSKKSDSNVCSCIWDLDDIKETGFYESFRIDKEHINILSNEGTIVQWEKCDKLAYFDNDYYNNTLNSLALYIGETFGRYIFEEAIDIYLNNLLIDQIDPFEISSESTICMPNQKISIDNKLAISISPYVITNKPNTVSQDLLEKQGFYIYRNKRLVEMAGWLGMFKSNEVSKLGRIKVDVTNEHDDYVGININKTSINKINPRLWNALKKVAHNTRKKSLENYRVKGKVIKRGQKQGNFENVWLIQTKKGKKSLKINKNHPLLLNLFTKENKSIIKLIEDAIPLEAILSFEKDFDFSFNDNKRNYLEMGYILYEYNLSKGASTTESIKYLASIEPFSTNPELIALIEEGVRIK